MGLIRVVAEQRGDGTAVVRAYVNGMAPLRVGLQIKYERLRVNLGVLPMTTWDARRQRPKATYNRRDGGALSAAIDLAVVRLHRAYMEVDHKTAEKVRARYLELCGRAPRTQSRSMRLRDIVQSWMGDERLRESTRSTYRGFLQKVIAYEKTHAKIDLTCSDTDELSKLIHWSVAVYSLSNNSGWAAVKILNKAIRQSQALGSKTTPLSLFKYKTPWKRTLDWEAVARLAAYEPKSKFEAEYLTIAMGFLTTSVRVSDIWKMFSSIGWRNQMLTSEFEVTKHPSPRVGPLIWEPLRRCIEKYGLPARRSNQAIRLGVAGVLRAAGLPVVQIHDLRRSWVTNMMALDAISPYLLGKLNTGHRMVGGGSSKTLMGYEHGSLAQAQITMVRILRDVPKQRTAGLVLLTPDVCDPLLLTP